MSSLSVVTFNCEWRKPSHPHGREILKRIRDLAPDIVCLTEAHTGYFADGHELASVSHDPHHPTRRKVLIWSKKPWKDVDQRGHPLMLEGRYLGACTFTRIGEIRVHGVVISYRMQDVSSGCQPWRRHLDFLHGLDRLLEREALSTLLLGDFNQRVPRKFQSLDAFRALESVVLSRFALATGGPLEPLGKQAIDHICHSHDLRKTSAFAISNLYDDGAEISDHFGVAAQFVRRNWEPAKGRV